MLNRQLSGIRKKTLLERLGPVPDVDPDRYGDGGPVETLEKRVAELLGTEAALFVPTGTMAQQIALRCWADRTHNPIVAMHPRAHPLNHEDDALTVLSGLRPVEVRDSEVGSCPEPYGTLLLEVPDREAGFVLPTWDELTSLVDLARERDAVVHLDGARLWESTYGLGKPLPEIAGLFDSVYVSFYKSLEGVSGAALAGSQDFVDQARVWRHRYGGMLFQQWPAALSALHGLDTVLPRLGLYVEHAKVVAAALDLPEPHTHQFALHLPGDPARLTEVSGPFLGGFWRDGTLAKTEITVAEPALEWTADEVREAWAEFRSLI
ncbi:beta-eliminating lyase-related protein [Lentzea sp. DG1S-22]|uniref:threonine aldolase family protein n=1 Tax=Lentzea sp. DG1S-22 TaxID=3108822 RepID=UPI002E775B0B|nr:beta-eliminating lyase-related protein [Lentzea sp. DG1S-22]WVH80321.1 beta-eliminating lyase-related protein [Lentzea sp. DG1S-22]